MKIGIEHNLLRYALQNAYFITGTAYAGKSTMVKLLARQYDGICCGENYHDILFPAIEKGLQPNLCYLKGRTDWQEFISRTPEEYDAWVTGCAKEAAELELIRLLELRATGKKVFVDTNIPLEQLKLVSDYHRVAVMLSPQSMSVEHFFDREDEEKQFLLGQIRLAPDPEKAMRNFKACLARINSPQHYAQYAHSGFFTYVREGKLTIEQTADLLASHFRLQ